MLSYPQNQSEVLQEDDGQQWPLPSNSSHSLVTGLTHFQCHRQTEAAHLTCVLDVVHVGRLLELCMLHDKSLGSGLHRLLLLSVSQHTNMFSASEVIRHTRAIQIWLLSLLLLLLLLLLCSSSYLIIQPFYSECCVIIRVSSVNWSTRPVRAKTSSQCLCYHKSKPPLRGQVGTGVLRRFHRDLTGLGGSLELPGILTSSPTRFHNKVAPERGALSFPR